MFKQVVVTVATDSDQATNRLCPVAGYHLSARFEGPCEYRQNRNNRLLVWSTDHPVE